MDLENKPLQNIDDVSETDLVLFRQRKQIMEISL
jgi:hypothetical protein